MVSNWFNRRRRRLPSVWVRAQDKANRKLQVWSNYLQKRTQRVPLIRLRIFFLVIVVVYGLWNIWLIVVAFYRPAGVRMGDQIRMPQYVVKSPLGKQREHAAKIAGAKEWEEFIDSVKSTQAGKSMVDSLDRVKPGLLDSIEDLERRFAPAH